MKDLCRRSPYPWGPRTQLGRLQKNIVLFIIPAIRAYLGGWRNWELPGCFYTLVDPLKAFQVAFGLIEPHPWSPRLAFCR